LLAVVSYRHSLVETVLGNKPILDDSDDDELLVDDVSPL